MSDIWKLGQEINAADYYNKLKKTPLLNEVIAAKALTVVCNKMNQAYDDIIQDQNEYLIEIETSYEDMSTIEADIQAQIKELEEKLADLLKKQEDGNITESEQAEISSLNSELSSLRTQGDEQLGQKQDDIGKLQDEAKNNQHKSKKTIATNYGETAIEKGEPLSETKDKRKSFWRKIFGGWNKVEEREAGKNLIQAGNDLLEKVSCASEINETILKKTKSSI